METKTVDVRGVLCPIPVIETKKVVDSDPQAVVTTIVDNEVSRDNVRKFGESRGYVVQIEANGQGHYITLTPSGVTPVAVTVGIPTTLGGRVLLITKDYLGEGSEELGRNLMKTFWMCLTEADAVPDTIYFINSAVKMVVNDSVHLDNLKKLVDRGVTLAACGICLDYYQLKEQLGVGSVTNMYAITDAIVGKDLVKL